MCKRIKPFFINLPHPPLFFLYSIFLVNRFSRYFGFHFNELLFLHRSHRIEFYQRQTILDQSTNIQPICLKRYCFFPRSARIIIIHVIQLGICFVLHKLNGLKIIFRVIKNSFCRTEKSSGMAKQFSSLYQITSNFRQFMYTSFDTKMQFSFVHSLTGCKKLQSKWLDQCTSVCADFEPGYLLIM